MILCSLAFREESYYDKEVFGFLKDRRKLLKTVTWSLTALSITCLVGWAITGSLAAGGSIGIICRLIKIPTYWLHETVYDRC